MGLRCLMARSRPRDRNAAGSKPDSTEDPPCTGPAALQITRPPLVRRGSLKRGAPVQVSPSSSDCGSKCRGSSLNNPRVASKRDVNLTQPNLLTNGTHT
ncbi:hypothetical protein AVEN_54500-1 [Araneus ventricosus]|uniref:Uncharacterized protein n=1 Tax=Araneus ventricosus TaxID=182803 RepID=A0A4Y2EKN7_ARAVE|nr:hypothetical protein AVEN_54500-1 [Araneus ventricosus]